MKTDERTLDRLMRDLIAGRDPLGTARMLAALGEAAVQAALDPSPYGPVPEGRDPRDLSADLSMVLQLAAALDARPLLDRLQRDGPRDSVLYALRASRDPATVEALADAAAHQSAAVRAQAVPSLGWTGDPRAIASLVRALEDRDGGIRMSAVTALSRFHHPPVVRPAIRRLLGRPRIGPGEQLYGERLLATLDGPAGFDAIAQATRRDLALLDADLPAGLVKRARSLADRLGRLGDRHVVWWSRSAPPRPDGVRFASQRLPVPLDPGHVALILEVGCVRIGPPGGGAGWTVPGTLEAGPPWSDVAFQASLRVPQGAALVPLAFRDDEDATIGYGADGHPCVWRPGHAPEPVDTPDALGWFASLLERLEGD